MLATSLAAGPLIGLAPDGAEAGTRGGGDVDAEAVEAGPKVPVLLLAPRMEEYTF
jgi:hypothetical protein